MPVPPPRSSARRPARAAVVVWLALAACGGSATPPDAQPEPPLTIPARGGAATLDVATWNLEWFGDPGNGPTDEARQLRRVRDVIQGTDLDLWGVQEVVGAEAFASLLAELPGYAGLLANHPSVRDGPAFYSDFGDREQKVGLIWRTSVVQVLDARLILTERDHEFAGRPPLQVRVRLTLGGETLEGVVVVLHAKAGADEPSWVRREAGARALRAWLDATWPDTPVWILGDFNDDVDTSILEGRPTPYAPFLDAESTWSFPTGALSRAGVSSTLGYRDVIDHHLVSDEVLARYRAGSAEAYRVDAHVPDYGSTTSDHLPVLTRYGME